MNRGWLAASLIGVGVFFAALYREITLTLIKRTTKLGRWIGGCPNATSVVVIFRAFRAFRVFRGP